MRRRLLRLGGFGASGASGAAARALAAALAVVATPAVAHACAVCSLLGNENVRLAFFNTTIFLSLLPLALIALALIWLRRKAKGTLEGEFRESDEDVAATDVAPEADPRS